MTTFPCTPIIDSGAGADSNPIQAPWDTGTFWGESALKRLSNQIVSSVAGFSSGDPLGVVVGPDCEFYYTVPTLPGTTFYLHLRANVKAATQATLTDYFLQCNPTGGANNWELQRITLGVGNVLANGTQAFAAGDSIGFRVESTRLSGFYKSGAGAWNQTPIVTFVDATYQYAGYMVTEIPNSTMTVTNVGGGTMVPPPKPQPVPFMSSRRI